MSIQSDRSRLALFCFFCFWSTGFGQDQNPLVQQSSNGDSVAALLKIGRDYRDYLGKGKQITENFGKAIQTLKDTEADTRNIQTEAVRQQLLALQSALFSIDLELSAFSVVRKANREIENTPIDTYGQFVQMTQRKRNAETNRDVLMTAKGQADLDVARRGVELQQLSTAQRAVVQRRIETIQKGHSLQQEWMQWHSDWSKFMDRYWPHSDPERRFTNAEVQTRLEALAQADPQDFAAMITSALLLQRIGKHQQALEMVDNSLIIKHSLETTAQLAKISILLSLKKNKEAKALQLAITKAQAAAPQAQQHPIDRWLKARIAASQKQYPQAEVEWKALINHKPMELEARRALAMLGFVRAEKSPAEGKRALKEAQLAMDLEPRPDWFSHFVLGAAMHAADQGAKAREVLSEAAKTATAENLQLCDRLTKHIEDGEPFEWDFVLAGGLLQTK